MNDRERYACLLDRDRNGAVLTARVRRESLDGASREVAINGSLAPVVIPYLHQILRSHGVNGRAWSGRASIELDQIAGAQAELLLRALKPMRRLDRIDQVAAGIASMGREEASYWHAKAERPRGLRVLRLLFSGDTRRRR